jgi:hypothetical protein
MKRYNPARPPSSKKIVAGNEPAVSGGLGSQAITHNGDGAM